MPSKGFYNKVKLNDLVSVKQFGAKGDGVTDDTVALQAALNSGENLYLDSGTYIVSAALNVTISNTSLVGDGNASLIMCAASHGTADVFLVGDGATEISGLTFAHFVVWAASAKGGGYVFNCRYVTDSLWQSVRAGSIDKYFGEAPDAHRLYDGYYFNRFSQCVLEGGEIVVANDGVVARGNADQSFGAELSVDGGLRIFKPGRYGVHLGGGAGGVYLTRMDVSEAGTAGVRCSPDLAGVQNRELFLSPGCTIDSCLGWGVNVESGGLAFLEGNGLWVCANGTNASATGGVRLAASGLSSRWAGARIESNKYDGVQISGGSHVIVGGFIAINGIGANGGHGLSSVAHSDLTLVGASVHTNGNVTRGHGVNLPGGGLDNYTVTACTFFSNGQGTVYTDTAPAATRVISGNRGHVTENTGTATILITDTTVVVPHGLSAAPTHVDVGFAGPQDGGAYAYVAPGDVNATDFTITYSTAAGAARDFWWRAVRGAA